MPVPEAVRTRYEVIPRREEPGHWRQLTARAQALLGLGNFLATRDHPPELPSSLIFREILAQERKRRVFRDHPLLVLGVGDARDVVSVGKVREVVAIDIKDWKCESVHHNLRNYKGVPVFTLGGDAVEILRYWEQTGEKFDGRVLVDLPQEPRRDDRTHYDEIGLGLQSDALKALHSIATAGVLVYVRLDDRFEEQGEPLTVFDEQGWSAERIYRSLVPQDPDVKQIEWMQGKIPDTQGLFYNSFMEPISIAAAIESTRATQAESLQAATALASVFRPRVYHTASVYKLRKK